MLSFYPFLCFDHLSVHLKESRDYVDHEDESGDHAIVSTLLEAWIKDSNSPVDSFPVIAMHDLVERIRDSASNGTIGSDHLRQESKLARQVLQALLVRCSSKEPLGNMSSTWEVLKLSAFFAAHMAMLPNLSEFGMHPSEDLNETGKGSVAERPPLQDTAKARQDISLACLKHLVACCDLLLKLDNSGALDRLPPRDCRAMDKVWTNCGQGVYRMQHKRQHAAFLARNCVAMHASH